MTEEPDSKDTAPPPEKLLVDNPSDFLFHAAYLAYSKAYDKAADPEAKRQLNDNIVALQKKDIDGPTFYRNIDKYRAEDIPQRGFVQAMIKTQKKREWRRKVQRSERIERHKK
jgi:hypothetical protein